MIFRCGVYTGRAARAPGRAAAARAAVLEREVGERETGQGRRRARPRPCGAGPARRRGSARRRR